MLSSESSAEPGKWYTSRTPYMREPMEAVTNPDVETIVLMTSTQVGKTELCSNVIGYFIHQDPAPILMIEPTLEIAEAYSKDRLAPMLRDTPVLAGLVPEARSRKTGSTMLHKAFPGGHLTIAGSNSPSSLASRPIRILICDEVDRYEATVEGHAVNLATKRTTNFWNRKKLFVSSPKFKKTSMIEAAFLESDRNYYHVPCWACKKWQKLEWAQVKWTEHDPKTALYVCSHCGAGWNDAQRYEAIMDGIWIPEDPYDETDTDKIVGFHLWEAYNPWIKLREIVAAFLAAHEKQKQGDNEPMKTFINTSLGQTWEEKGETVSADPLMSRREDYTPDRIPYRILYLTAGVDVQDDRIEVEVVGWRAEKRGQPEESWGVEVMVLHGDPAKPEIWDQLDEILKRDWTTKDGRKLKLGAVGVDSGGHFTNECYKFCSARTGKRIYAVKGMRGTRPIWPPKVGKSKKYKGHAVWIVGVDTAKDAIYSRLRIKDIGPGYCHFPETESYGKEFFKQLTSEEIKTRFSKGHPIREWHKPAGVRNEALDRRAYALAALYSRAIPWEILARTAPTELPEPQAATDAPAIAAPQAPRPAKPATPIARTAQRSVRFRMR